MKEWSTIFLLCTLQAHTVREKMWINKKEKHEICPLKYTIWKWQDSLEKYDPEVHREKRDVSVIPGKMSTQTAGKIVRSFPFLR